MTTAAPRGIATIKRKLVAFGLALATIVALSGCTFHAGRQAEIDYLGVRIRLYLYQKPTHQIAWDLRDIVCNKGSRETRGRCILTFLRDISVWGAARPDWNIMTEGNEWADIMEAIDNVRAGGRARDSAGNLYSRRCLVVDRAAFQDPNWTWRDSSDAHCKRGSYAS